MLCPPRRCAAWFALALALGLPGPAARAGEVPLYLYTAEERGQVSVQGTVLETLAGQFAPKNLFAPHGTNRWTDFAVVGDQRYSLRLDGRIERNGTLLRELPFEVAGYIWQAIDLDGVGVGALRSDGLLAVDALLVAMFPRDGHVYYDLAFAGGHRYALRADGAVFQDDDASAPVAKFKGGDGNNSQTDGNGTFGDKHWKLLVFDPDSGLLLGLRGDGRLHSLDTTTFETAEVAKLPFPKNKNKIKAGDLYIDLETAAGSPWYVLRKDGRIYNAVDPTQLLVNLPGKSFKHARDEYYVDLALLGGATWGLRRDGGVFSGDTGAEVLKPSRSRWMRLVATDVQPVLEGADEYPPVAAVMRLRLVAGMGASLPIVVNDVNVPTDELGVSVDLSGLPGASFDAGTNTVSWPNPAPVGKTSFVVRVDDGRPEPTEFTYRIRVHKQNPGQGNKPPLLSRIDPVQALVGVPLVLPLVAVDPDGDALTWAADLDQGAFIQGATFDDVSATFFWTPSLADVGRTTASVTVSDGTKTVRLRWKLDVVSPLQYPAR